MSRNEHQLGGEDWKMVEEGEDKNSVMLKQLQCMDS